MHKNITTFLSKEIFAYNASGQPRKILKNYADDIRQGAKRIIMIAQKEQKNDAFVLLQEVQKSIKEAEKIVRLKNLFDYGPYKAALEEYLEAWLTYQFLFPAKKFPPIPTFTSVDREMYFGAISDFTGELVRIAILDATQGKTTRLLGMKQLVEDLIIACTQLEVVSGGYLRQKVEQLDKNLRKIEDIAYTVKVMRGKTSASEGQDEE